MWGVGFRKQQTEKNNSSVNHTEELPNQKVSVQDNYDAK